MPAYNASACERTCRTGSCSLRVDSVLIRSQQGLAVAEGFQSVQSRPSKGNSCNPTDLLGFDCVVWQNTSACRQASSLLYTASGFVSYVSPAGASGIRSSSTTSSSSYGGSPVTTPTIPKSVTPGSALGSVVVPVPAVIPVPVPGPSYGGGTPEAPIPATLAAPDVLNVEAVTLQWFLIVHA